MANLPLIKECLGFLGTVMVLVPWLRDYWGRLKLAVTRRIKARGSLGDLVENVAAHRQAWLSDPKKLDLWLTMIGLGLIAISFMLGVWLTI